MPRPSCTILGGTNGSGKSSIYDALRPVGVFVNADVIARQIDPRHPESASVAAGRRALELLADLVSKQEDFVFETTLSGRQPLDLMRRAREAGYAVRLSSWSCGSPTSTSIVWRSGFPEAATTLHD